MSGVDKNCTFLVSTEKSTQHQQDDVCKLIESTDIPNKIDGLKKAITGMLAGESMPKVLMTVIR
jgi:coatomer subunit beta